jgi:6-phosphogluconolactonase (cycloisomerase 2 family)
MKFANFFLASAARIATASPTSFLLPDQGMNLFVAAYSGVVRSINLSGAGHVWNLKNLDDSRDCGKNPSWLTYDASKRHLYCLNEAFDEVNGTVTALSVSKDGKFSKLGSQTLLSGPVSAELNRRGNKSDLVIAHYRYPP